MIEAFIIPFVTILFAELFDKSQLAILLLATKTKKYVQLLIGVMTAFFIVDGAAILFGSILTSLITQLWLKIISGILFLFFGILSLKNSEEEETITTKKMANPLITGFLFVFFSEWGDKTQLASAVFATTYHPFFVFLGVCTALLFLSVMAIFLGGKITNHIRPILIHRIAGILFLLLGILFLFS